MIASRLLLRALHVAAALCALGSGAHGQTRSDVVRGHDLAQQACAGCHAMDGGQGSTVQGAPVPSFRAIAGRPDLSAGRLQALITTPRHPMPAISLGLAEINDLVAYIHSLR